MELPSDDADEATSSATSNDTASSGVQKVRAHRSGEKPELYVLPPEYILSMDQMVENKYVVQR